MNRLLTFTHITDHGYACLEDKDGNAVAMPRVWMPKEARPGQVLHAVCVSNDDVSSLFIEIANDWHTE